MEAVEEGWFEGAEGVVNVIVVTAVAFVGIEVVVLGNEKVSGSPAPDIDTGGC